MVTGTTKIVRIIGDPVSESLSPRMHTAAFAHDQLDWFYSAWQVSSADLLAAIRETRDSGIAGLNVTMPHKGAVIKLLDDVDETALAIRSVNTIVNYKGKLKGYSTDGEGFKLALADDDYQATGKKVLMIGAGGAARAVGRAIAGDCPESISILCRDLESGRELAEIVEAAGAPAKTLPIDGAAAIAEAKQSDLIINATPLGKHSLDDIKFLADGLQPGQFVADMSTVPPLSAFLVAAQDRGCRVMGGLGMLVRQGSLSYKLWTGQDAPLDVMRRAIGMEL